MGTTFYNCRAPHSAQKAANPSPLPPSVNRLSAALSRLFAGLGFGMLHRRVCTTHPALGSAEPNRRQILVGVVARADLPAVDVRAQRHQPIPPKRVDIMRLLVQHALVVLEH